MIWQFFSLSHGRVFRRVVGELISLPVHLTLDLEDSVGDPSGDPVQNKIEKDKARESLLKILLESDQVFPLERLSVRINGIETPYFQNDLEAIRRIQQLFQQGISIIVPKVESPETLEQVHEDLVCCGVAGAILHPTAESPEGMRNLDRIVSGLNPDQSMVFLGIMDLQLAQQRFPFVEADSDEFTAFFSNHLISLRKRSLRVCVGPICHFAGPRVVRMMAKLEAALGFTPDYVSLATSQSRALLGFEDKRASEDLEFPSEPRDLARFIVDHYERHAKAGKRVVVYRQNRFISPHEYLMAKRFLEFEDPCSA